MKISQNEMRPLVTKKPESKRAKRGSHLKSVAEKYGVHVETLRKRAQRHPDKSLEELAKEPPMARSEIGRQGKHAWQKLSERERAKRESKR